MSTTTKTITDHRNALLDAEADVRDALNAIDDAEAVVSRIRARARTEAVKPSELVEAVAAVELARLAYGGAVAKAQELHRNAPFLPIIGAKVAEALSGALDCDVKHVETLPALSDADHYAPVLYVVQDGPIGNHRNFRTAPVKFHLHAPAYVRGIVAQELGKHINDAGLFTNVDNSTVNVTPSRSVTLNVGATLDPDEVVPGVYELPMREKPEPIELVFDIDAENGVRSRLRTVEARVHNADARAGLAYATGGSR